MRIGIIGLPQSGKTTLFNALTQTSLDGTQAAVSKKEVHLSIVKVPDSRLDWLHELHRTVKKVQATIEYVDVAGLSRGSTQHKGFQEQFLGNVRNVDALLCVLRCFKNVAVPHPEGNIDPQRDFSIIEEEFLLSDMAVLEGRIERLCSELKKVKNEQRQRELDLLRKCLSTLESETPLREISFTDNELKLMKGFQFLTAKPILLVLNIDEQDVGRESGVKQEFAAMAEGKNKILECVSAKLEMEIAQLAEDERESFQKEMGITESALHKVIRNSYQLLGLISFFTLGDKEVRAWTIQQGTRAQSAAGTVHSDMERGFIRAEVVDFKTLNELGSMVKCKEHGLLRLEGKNYLVKDGDVITFRFNV
ncbi:MAG: redox-regulated ATPase YchF [bacterium]